jgi:uncharacterized DUF497 family protein
MLRGAVVLDGILFEWDPEKAESNFRKHKVTFEEASTIFGDPLSITIPDPAHSRGRSASLRWAGRTTEEPSWWYTWIWTRASASSA